MKINFVKMQAQGNDYIYFERKNIPFSSLPSLAVKLSDRHKGVGSDGIIVLEKSDGGVIFKIFNADGSEGKICGNGIRSAGVYAVKHMGLTSPVKFFTLSGEKTVDVKTVGEKFIATADMGKPKEFLSSEFFTEKLQEVDLYVNERDVFAINVGNDHAVFFSGLPLDYAVSHTRSCNLFTGGINVECAVKSNGGGLRAEVFERGSGKTLSCGSGAVAVAYSAVISKRAKRDEFIPVKMPGGTLEVKINGDGNAFLRGEVEEVFKGEYEI